MPAAESGDVFIHIEENVCLAPLTSFGIGGPARYFTRASTAEELKSALSYATMRGLDYYILGGGTNILVSDKGVDGLVIRMELDAIDIADAVITAQAGAELAGVIETAADHGLTGIECLAGIPGTFGGAVRGNAGAYGTVTGSAVIDVLALNAGTLEYELLPAAGCCFQYRSSRFKRDRNLIIISARLALSAGPKDEIRQKMDLTIEKRSAFLEHEKSVGSFFINPMPREESLIREFEQDRNVRCRNCMIPAGWFIDRAGLRGMRIGGAMVSEKHGNYLINTGDATADDVVRLAEAVKQKVREKMGIELQEEVNYVGF